MCYAEFLERVLCMRMLITIPLLERCGWSKGSKPQHVSALIKGWLQSLNDSKPPKGPRSGFDLVRPMLK